MMTGRGSVTLAGQGCHRGSSQAVRWHMGADVPARGSTGTALKVQPPRPIPADSWTLSPPGQEGEPGGITLFHRKEPKARKVESCSFSRDTCLYPGFLIRDSLTSKDFFLLINKIILLII